MNKRLKRYLQLMLMIMDFSIIYFVHFVFRKYFHLETGVESVWVNSLFIPFAWLLLSLYTGIYSEREILAFNPVSAKSYKWIFLLVIIVFLYYLVLKFHVLTLGQLSIYLVTFSFCLLINRLLFLRTYNYIRNRHSLVDNVLILGYNNLSKKVIKNIETYEINKRVVGICDEDENINELTHYPILSNISNALEVCKEYDVKEIYSSIAPEKNREIYKLIQEADLNFIHFRIIPDMSVFVNKQAHSVNVNGLTMLALRREPLENIFNRFEKKALDVIFSALVVVLLLSWLIPIVGLLILLDSRGPIFFTQLRNGQGNKKFRCLKFRSMRLNTDANEKQATSNDQRFTRLGKLLRRTSIDELPQFINVLKGDMSIVGPRPHMLKHTDEYSKVVNEFMVRHFIKPGITGWAQVNGLRGEIKSQERLEKRVKFDLWYLEHWSIKLDLKIMLLTVWNFFKGDRYAY